MNLLSIFAPVCAQCKKVLNINVKESQSASDNVIELDSKKCFLCNKTISASKPALFKIDLPFSEIKKIIFKNEKIDELKMANERLLADKQQLTEDSKLYRAKFSTLVSKLSEAVVVVDRHGKINDTNVHFIELLDKKTKELIASEQSVVGMELRNFVSDEFHHYIMTAQNIGNEFRWFRTTIGEVAVSASVFPVRRGDYTIIVLRNLSKPAVVYDETRQLLESVIDHNLEMVQKIGYLVGEEMSQSSNLIRQTINSLKESIKERERIEVDATLKKTPKN